MGVDLHVHAKERSGCSRSGEEEMIQAAIFYGLDGMAFTDHHRLVPLGRLEELNRKYAPFRVFGGIEITLGEGEDVLIWGVHELALETQDWAYPDLVAFVRERGGFLAIAHPFRFHDSVAVDIEAHPPDAIEVCSIHIGAGDGQRIRAIQEWLGLQPLCNSDAHRAEHVGIYHNRLARAPQDERDLLEILKTGAYACRGDEDRIAAFNREIEATDRWEGRLIA